MLQLQGIDHISGIYIFSLFLFLAVYIHNVLTHCIVAEAGCNWYLHDINIFPLTKKTVE